MNINSLPSRPLTEEEGVQLRDDGRFIDLTYLSDVKEGPGGLIALLANTDDKRHLIGYHPDEEEWQIVWEGADEEPAVDELLAPEDVPDHQNPELLAALYDEHDGNYTAMCRDHEFDVTSGRVRHYLIEFGIHDPTPHGATNAGEDDGRAIYRDPDWLQKQYDAADGNVSHMHRQIDVDVPYRTLLKNLKRFDIHDPSERRSARRRRSMPDDTAEESEPEPRPKPEPAESTDVDEEDVGEEPAKPSIEWDFEPGFTFVEEQEEQSHNRLTEDEFCSSCGTPYDGDGVCESCENRLTDDLVGGGDEVHSR